MPPESGTFALQETTISVEGGEETAAVSFTNLSIHQQLADTNSFSFVWRTANRDTNFSAHVDFYRANLGKEVTINIGDSFTFRGFIYAINCINQGSSAITNDYHVEGKGLFAKLDEVEECNSFYHKTLSDIFNALNVTQNTTLNVSPSNTSELFYHVQYNSTTFNFYRMLAARYGEWLYYTGEQMNLSAPGGDAIELQNARDVRHLQLNAAVRKTDVPAVGYDQYSGEVLRNTPSAESRSGVTGASTGAADAAFGSEHTGRRIATAPTGELLREMNTLMQRAAAASAVYLEGTTQNPQINLGKKIRITDSGGNSEGEYIITQVYHSASDASNYQNQFVAVPADVQVPPYTNSLIYPVCNTQPAIVVDNVDADGLDRIKVRFPWMQETETTPWISVMVPYAGSGRGMRFVPEVDEEVMIGFMDNNAERPIMIGSFYTSANTSGIPHEGNHIKAFGTRSGRRLEIDDEEGTLRIFDNFSTESPINGIKMTRKDSDTNIMIETKMDNQNYTVVRFNKDTSLSLGVVNGGELKTEIRLLKEGPEIVIHSKGKININAEGDMELTAGGNMKLSASNKLEMKGTGGVEITGSEIKATADASLQMKGVTTVVEGSATLDAKGGAMAKIQAALVKIN